jgi:DNA helicase II / ATP-dependent DNA helicase PcrA
MNNLTLVLGGPGCGKTTRLLEIVEEHLAAGVPPQDIAFVTFTRAAATEAAERAAKKFNLDSAALPWFRTIHSLCYARLGIQRDEVMGSREWKQFGELVGEKLTGHADASDVIVAGGRETGDILLRIVDYAATTLATLEEAWRQLDEPVDRWRLERFASTLKMYKQDTGKMDFTDMLLMYLQDGPPINARVVVIDEGQDLTAAQWSVVRRAFGGAQQSYVGGDDDQAIYHWAGADVAQFLSLSDSPQVLGVSHRLPQRIHALAQSVSSRISRRYSHAFAPSARVGSVEWHQYPDSVGIGDGSWLMLARNNYMLHALEVFVRACGIPYIRYGRSAVDQSHVAAMYLWERLRTGKQPDMDTKEVRQLHRAKGIKQLPQLRELQRYTLADFDWHGQRDLPWFQALDGIPPSDRDFYLACLRRGENLKQPPRIRLSTIHGVKGAEADHVLLMTDMSQRTARGYELAPDHEHRVFYVALTRARESLHLIMPQSSIAYPLAG